MSTADDLRAAARYMEEHGHCTETAWLPTGQVCAGGAIAKVLGLPIAVVYGEYHSWENGGERWAATTQALRHYLREQGVKKSIPVWNDASDQHTVVTALEKAAAWIEEQV